MGISWRTCHTATRWTSSERLVKTCGS
uniref:Uncharacterized protein n=1 Tax=Anguilla anguilla TaxID=7936 RepID=A0A0E9V3B0_ANGAN